MRDFDFGMHGVCVDSHWLSESLTLSYRYQDALLSCRQLNLFMTCVLARRICSWGHDVVISSKVVR